MQQNQLSCRALGMCFLWRTFKVHQQLRGTVILLRYKENCNHWVYNYVYVWNVYVRCFWDARRTDATEPTADTHFISIFIRGHNGNMTSIHLSGWLCKCFWDLDANLKPTGEHDINLKIKDLIHRPAPSFMLIYAQWLLIYVQRDTSLMDSNVQTFSPHTRLIMNCVVACVTPGDADTRNHGNSLLDLTDKWVAKKGGRVCKLITQVSSTT